MPIQSIPNEQQLEDDGVPLNDFRRNKNETFSINSDRITSMEKNQSNANTAKFNVECK